MAKFNYELNANMKVEYVNMMEHTKTLFKKM